MSVIPEEYFDLLQSTALAHISTIGSKGEPQSSPVWFVWDGTHICFSQKKGRQKYRNLLREPRIALSIVDPNNPFRFIEIRGDVVRMDDDHPDYSFARLATKKYTNQDVAGGIQPGEERVVVVIEPKHITVMPTLPAEG